ncbi:phytanoyl-CoA dioxygenase family protein [Paenibacillus allorhizosphaerae]|uniref:L-proline trans-4-hydroxylase n=1 Tax=Paenibacillus allorhizosphaerae TaxID=2849866 RepID=A0ABM8V9U8_9BACL|nr:phytanoyl-CoA dioxygenase family protein [Paenibacillus allorhizosphaerae]CAG7614427.1 L-proline trans-4-hydroxylase [Paenibacillus allorhizosphaerae]
MTTHAKLEYERTGYTVLKQTFSEEQVKLYKEEAQKVLEQYGVGKEGVYLGMSVASAVFKEAAAHPVLVNALKEIIGDDVVFLSDKLVFKNASTDFGSPWHQDYPYWKGSHKVSVWIALDDATPDNGCLRVVPGSHLKGAARHGGDASDGLGFKNRLEEQDLDGQPIVDLLASRGDAIIFHDLLYHASYPNISGQDRWALISTYKDGTQEDPEYPWAKAVFRV